MRVSDILARKPSDATEVIDKNAKIADAANRLASLRIGSLIVSPDGKKVEGIISERDIVRVLGMRGGECLSLLVSDVMTSDVKSVAREDLAEDALKAMSEGRFRHLPVVDKGKLVGIISIGDVVSARLAQMEAENSALADMISGAAY